MSDKKFYKDSIVDAIGNTPLVRMGNLSKENNIKANLLAKLEFMNPSGSVKDRMAVYILDKAVASGELKPGDDAAEVGYFGRDDLPPMAFSVHKKVIMSVI